MHCDKCTFGQIALKVFAIESKCAHQHSRCSMITIRSKKSCFIQSHNILLTVTKQTQCTESIPIRSIWTNTEQTLDLS